MCFIISLQIKCQSFRPAIRVRLNRQVFDQASSIVRMFFDFLKLMWLVLQRLQQSADQLISSFLSFAEGLVEYEVPRVNIPATRQCFTEGCVDVSVF